MRLYKMALSIILLGILFLGYAVIIGDANIALFIIFPVIYGEGFYSIVGIFLIMIGIFVLFLSPINDLKYSMETNVDYKYINDGKKNEIERDLKYSGIIFIGPIPIVFGSDKHMIKLSILVGILFVIGVFLFYFLTYR